MLRVRLRVTLCAVFCCFSSFLGCPLCHLSIDSGCVFTDHAQLVTEHDEAEECKEDAKEQNYDREYHETSIIRVTLLVVVTTNCSNCHTTHRPARGHSCVEIEQQKGLLVVKSYAVVHPRTVVIHFEDTVSASAAVMAAWRLSTVTLVANFAHFIPNVANLAQSEA